MRQGELKRTTKETDIYMSLNLDGSGKCDVQSGIGFFDHMLELLAHHSKFDLTLKCKGDTNVDGHHSIEDIGIVFGKLLYELLGDKKGIARFAHSYAPMDESLCRCVVDISGRPYLSFNATFAEKIGSFDSELIEEFFRAVTSYGFITAHIDLIRGENSHHKAEAVFKSFALSLASAVTIVGSTVPSSKGVIE